jgi:hypothetical protein
MSDTEDQCYGAEASRNDLLKDKERVTTTERLVGRVVEKVIQGHPDRILIIFKDGWVEIRAVDKAAQLGWDDSYRPDEYGDVQGYNVSAAVSGKEILKAENFTYINSSTGKELKYFKLVFTDGGDATVTPVYKPQSEITLD